MHRSRMWLGAGIVAALAAGVIGIGPAGAAGNGTVVAKGKLTFVPNENVHSNQRFSPGTSYVASGGMLTLRNQDGQGEPHSFTIATLGDLPRTAEEAVENCEFCQQFFPQHFPDPDPNAPPVFVLNAGPPGLDEVGDSVLVFPGESTQVPVSAPAGTNLFYLCIFHPWMQGRINVR